MTDRDAIIEVITRLFGFTDNGDWPAVRACFAPQVHFDMTSLAGGEPAVLMPQQITDAWEQGLAPIEHVHHQAGNFLVDVDGNEAVASCYGIAYHYRKTNSGRNTRVFVGSYDFHVVKNIDRWEIDRFRFNVKFVDGNLNLEQD